MEENFAFLFCSKGFSVGCTFLSPGKISIEKNIKSDIIQSRYIDCEN
ncbi:hypothetical protein HMPREF1866_02089 [Lachnoanaerobaculum saburreum]|uniref:Uncharacterized protein n=1 Tax=Lachnoanaerobaculum saburreum TaxID=467210 RepID=A0A133ZJE1_9FIRM|nr:hypothetical protein HMPREF1866_02089 [Lachnoanaerobaculum saburreum]